MFFLRIVYVFFHVCFCVFCDCLSFSIVFLRFVPRFSMFFFNFSVLFHVFSPWCFCVLSLGFHFFLCVFFVSDVFHVFFYVFSMVFHGFSIFCRSSRHFLRQLPPSESRTTARGSVLHQRVYLVPGTKPAPTDGDFDGFIKKRFCSWSMMV